MQQYLEEFLQNPGSRDEGMHFDTLTVAPAAIQGGQINNH